MPAPDAHEPPPEESQASPVEEGLRSPETPPVPEEPSDAEEEDVSDGLYDELCALASRYMSREAKSHTLGTTALAHEAFLKLQDDDGTEDWNERGQVLAAASGAMRRILIDHARRKGRRKHAFGSLLLDAKSEEIAALLSPEGGPVDPLRLDAALQELAAIAPRRARVVELRFFGGHKVSEIAKELELSPRTVFDDWVFARAWLRRWLKEDAGASPE